jgi:hypothetical protein
MQIQRKQSSRPVLGKRSLERERDATLTSGWFSRVSGILTVLIPTTAQLVIGGTLRLIAYWKYRYEATRRGGHGLIMFLLPDYHGGTSR